jgi:hypothetical protein
MFIKKLFTKQKINKNNIDQHLINKQLSYIGKSIDDIKNDPNWFNNNKLTKRQYEKWKKYSIKVIQEVCDLDRQQAEYEFEWFYLNHGLMIKNN